MASERKIAANRANGRVSRGPKTAQGKKRSSQNARRHGLSLPVLVDPALSKEVEALAREIAGSASPAELQQARAVAEAQIDLVRIRRARHRLMAQNIASSSPAPSADGPPSSIPPEVLDQLSKIDRYEQRAMSRRKFAVRRLDLARRQTTAHDKDK